MDRDSNCHVELFHKPSDEKDQTSSSRTRFFVTGMGCPNCVIRVRNAILRLDGVCRVDVDQETGIAQVAFDAKTITPELIIPAVAAAGNDGRHNYQARLLS